MYVKYLGPAPVPSELKPTTIFVLHSSISSCTVRVKQATPEELNDAVSLAISVMENVDDVKSSHSYLKRYAVKVLAAPSTGLVTVPHNFIVPELNMSIGTGTPINPCVVVLKVVILFQLISQGHPFQPQVLLAM